MIRSILVDALDAELFWCLCIGERLKVMTSSLKKIKQTHGYRVHLNRKLNY